MLHALWVLYTNYYYLNKIIRKENSIRSIITCRLVPKSDTNLLGHTTARHVTSRMPAITSKRRQPHFYNLIFSVLKILNYRYTLLTERITRVPVSNDVR